MFKLGIIIVKSNVLIKGRMNEQTKSVSMNKRTSVIRMKSVDKI